MRVTRKYACAAIWLQDALSARAVDYPRSDKELYLLSLAKCEHSHYIQYCGFLPDSESIHRQVRLCGGKQPNECFWLELVCG